MCTSPRGKKNWRGRIKGWCKTKRLMIRGEGSATPRIEVGPHGPHMGQRMIARTRSPLLLDRQHTLDQGKCPRFTVSPLFVAEYLVPFFSPSQVITGTRDVTEKGTVGVGKTSVEKEGHFVDGRW